MPIIAIGGGELKDQETLLIDQFIVKQTQKAQPKALFIPTASGDAPDYIDTFNQVYGQLLGCDTRALCLSQAPSMASMSDYVAWADLIYVGGGNTRRMMFQWREQGLDQLLIEAHAAGTVLSGLSAGAICWFESGFSDSDSFESTGDWSYTRIEGLGLIPGLLCPHLDSEHRALPLLQNLLARPTDALALTDGAAAVVSNQQISVLEGHARAEAYRVTPSDDGLNWSRLR
jgi:dipeptidase E